MSKIKDFIFRVLSIFTTKKKKIHGMYTIAYHGIGGLQIQSFGFSASEYDPEIALSKLCEDIKQRHKIQEFAIINLVFFPK